MTSYTKIFKDLGKKDVNIAGGKGASLGEMTQAGIPVPPGFVILASAFDRFLKETDLLQEIENSLARINYEDINSVDKASLIIRDLIDKAKMPEDLQKEFMADFKKLTNSHSLRRRGSGGGFVAVRSSATVEDSSVASWAGELESYLNTTEETLLENIKKCWSSLFTPRAIFYRKEKDLHKTHVSVAVVVQVMIESEVSGITFTVHPVTEDKNQMIIEAAWGLGEAIVSGSVTPDSYVIDKTDWSLLDININMQKRQIVRDGKDEANKWIEVPETKQEKQILTGKQIIELARICNGIEKHYKHPQDIEWAFVDGKFYITQSTTDYNFINIINN